MKVGQLDLILKKLECINQRERSQDLEKLIGLLRDKGEARNVVNIQNNKIQIQIPYCWHCKQNYCSQNKRC